MIDISEEELVALKDVPALLPRRRKGRRPTFSCVWRWATRGYRGAKLETIRVGSTLCTSRDALQRFFEALSRETVDGSTGGQREECGVRAGEKDEAREF